MIRRPRLRLALCVGINAYPGAALSGCVNDAEDWRGELGLRNYKVTTLLDQQATRDAILGTLEGFVGTARYGDRIAFTYSGHGTWKPHPGGADASEPDGRDEALVPVDYRTAGLILDDDLHAVFSNARLGVRLYVFSDSCHSGSVARALGARVGDGVPRFLPPVEWIGDDRRALDEALAVDVAEATGRSRNGAVLVSGCEDYEYSYDASFGGRPNGAATYHGLRALGDAKTVADWHRRILTKLPDRDRGFEQHPVLTATARQRRWKPFD